MSDLKAQFEQATKDAQALSSRPSNDDMLKLYAHYKQGTTGDAQGKRPGRLKMVARAKFDAWERLKGMSTDDAMTAYTNLVASLKTS